MTSTNQIGVDYNRVIPTLNKKSEGEFTFAFMAEKEGFEPPDPSRGQRFSRPPHSTALPFLRPQR